MKLLQSRKFLTLALDALIAIVGLSVSFWVKDQAVAAYILGTVGALQPVFLGVIVMWGVEDAAALKAGTHPNQVLE